MKKKKNSVYPQKVALFCERYGTHGVQKDATEPTLDEAARASHAVLRDIQSKANKTTTR